MAVERKKFFDVEIPVMGRSTRLYGKSIKEFDKRIIKIDLTRNLRGKSLEASMVVKVENNKAIAEPKHLAILSSFIRRMVRDGVSYVEDSFTVECIDAKLRVKPFLITRKKVPRSVRKALRESAHKFISEDFNEKTRDEIVNDIVSNKLQRPLSLKLKKIYPLSLCEIRELKVEQFHPEKTIVRKPKVTEEKIEGESQDQMAEIQKEARGGEILDQMAEIEEALAKRAQKLKETENPAVTPEKASIEAEAPAAKSTEEKPKKAKKTASKKKKEETKG